MKTIFASLVVALSAVQASSTLVEDQVSISNLVLVTAKDQFDGKDKILKASLKDEAQLQATVDKYGCLLIVEKGTAYAYHKSSLGIDALEKRSAALQNLLKMGIKPYTCLETSGIDQSTYESLISSQVNQPVFRESYQKGKVKTCLEVGYLFSVETKGKPIVLTCESHATDEQRKQLTFDEVDKNLPDIRALPNNEDRLFFDASRIDHLSTFYSNSNTALIDKANLNTTANRLLSERLNKMKDEIVASRKALTESLMSNPENWRFEQIADLNAVHSLNDLPPKIRESVEENFANSYENYGFSSEDAARQFIKGAKFIGATNTVLLSYHIKHKDYLMGYSTTLILSGRP